MKIDGGIVEEQIKELDPTLVIYNRKDYQNEIHIYCERKYENRRVHQTIIRKVQDIPFCGKKVIIYLSVKRFKNNFDSFNSKKTITEHFDFLNDTKRRTIRLEETLYDLTKNQNFNASEAYAKKYIADISGNTLIRIFKKRQKFS